MHRLKTFPQALLLLMSSALALGVGCGGKKPAETPSAETESERAGANEEGDGEGDGAAAKKDECSGFDVADLPALLGKSACEEPDVQPDSIQPVDVKGKLEVTVTMSPTSIAPGGEADLLVSFANKTKEPMVLHFRIDPLPRFEVEAWDLKKNKRGDIPAGNPPPPPKGVSQPPPSDPKSARVTLAPNGTARARIPWAAVKTRWAPEKYRGTPPERGYPRVPAGSLPKGKYSIKVQTPLVGVSEGIDHEISAPRVDVEIGG